MTDEEALLKYYLRIEKEMREALEKGEIWANYAEGKATLLESFYGNGIVSKMDPYSAFFGEGKKLKLVWLKDDS